MSVILVSKTYVILIPLICFRICLSLKSGKYDLKPTDWPLFFFEDLVYDPEDDLKGLLKGTFLIWVDRLFPPFAVH